VLEILAALLGLPVGRFDGSGVGDCFFGADLVGMSEESATGVPHMEQKWPVSATEAPQAEHVGMAWVTSSPEPATRAENVFY
jgi:hypothetical protein